jgi:DNA polymerase III sliding clamp (beta) subunit (PCNA family)
MKLTINTALFQNMVAKAIKGANSKNDLLITQLMHIKLQDNVLTLTTTDSTNYLYISENKIAGDDFDVVVSADKFSKLISKLTCENVTLEVPTAKKGELDTLIIKGNGKYVLELPYDEEGELVEFDDPMSEVEFGDDWKQTTTKLSTVRLILSTAKAALLVGKDDMCYSDYYMGDRVVATDTYKICGIDIEMFDEPKLLSPQLVDLLDVMSQEDIEVWAKDDVVIFITENVTVYGMIDEGIEDYKIDAISGLLDEKFASSCKIEKGALVQMLDRLALFVDITDKNSVYLTFTKDGLLVSSKKDSGSEIIPYKESDNFTDYTCCLDIDLFRAQVKAYASDVIEMLYGKENSIKMVCGNVKQIVALAEDDRIDSEEE